MEHLDIAFVLVALVGWDAFRRYLARGKLNDRAALEAKYTALEREFRSLESAVAMRTSNATRIPRRPITGAGGS